jgi:hypothetical protein
VDADERLLDILATLIVGGAIVCLLGLILLPSVFVPVAICLCLILIALAMV